MPHKPFTEIVGGLTKLDWVDQIAPSLPSGQFQLAYDENWDTKVDPIEISNYGQYERQELPKGISGETTWLSFNLPVGTVVTLLEERGSGEKADLKGCGKAIDLVGTGQMETTNLYWYNMNDAPHAFFWRIVDLKVGAVELWQDANFESVKTTIFLSEWPVNEPVNINEWFLNDKISSARWRKLKDRQQFILYNDVDGKGSNYNEMSAWNKKREEAEFRNINFKDCSSSFLWKGAIPKKEIVHEFNLELNSTNTDSAVLTEETVVNDSDVNQKQSLTLKTTTTQTVTATTEDTLVTGVSQTITQKISGGVEIPFLTKASSETTASYSVKMEFTHKKVNTETKTESKELSVTHEVNIKARSKLVAKLRANIAKVPEKDYPVQVTRWYEESVLDGVQDPENSNWYKRDETIQVRLRGNLAVSKWVEYKEYPLNA